MKKWGFAGVISSFYLSYRYKSVFFLPKKRGRLEFTYCEIYFLRNIKNATTIIATIMAIVDPVMYVSVIGAGVGSGGGVG